MAVAASACGSAAVPESSQGVIASTPTPRLVYVTPAPTASAPAVASIAPASAAPTLAVPTPSPSPANHVVDGGFAVGSKIVTFRGTRGTYTWTAPTFNGDTTLVRWNVAAGSASCSVKWRVADSYGDYTSGNIKVIGKKLVTGSKTIDTSVMVDPSLAFTSTCPKWTMTMVKAPVKKASGGGSNCDPNYSGYCVPDVSYDLDCPDIAHRVYVVGYDKHGFDADNDRIGCESY
jgi:hypothetical protein